MVILLPVFAFFVFFIFLPIVVILVIVSDLLRRSAPALDANNPNRGSAIATVITAVLAYFAFRKGRL